MYSIMIQDLTTIRCGAAVTVVTQPADEWVGLAPFSDVVFWIETRAAALNGQMTAITLALETAPIKEDGLFKAMTNASVALNTVVGTVGVYPVLLTQTPGVPLGRWVRWKITVSGAPNADWAATFRVLACCNATAAAAP
jgi:hypothetical protein